MRKQNSKFETSFLSEEGSELKNRDYFAYVELDEFACYVLADGITDVADEEAAREAVETIITKFEEKPSLSKRAMSRYLNFANTVLLNAQKYRRLQASIVVVITDYEKLRYAHAGNVRLKLYRNSKPFRKTADTSLSRDLISRERLSEDALARHEERSNLYAYLGQKRFKPVISPKIKLMDADIITLYSKGIWENLSDAEMDDIILDSGKDGEETIQRLENAILDKHPTFLDNYSIATIYVDKIFVESDPTKKKRRRMMIIILIILLLLLIIIALFVYFYQKHRRERREDMEEHYSRMLNYIQYDNYKKADIECEEAVKIAQELRDTEQKELLYHYEQVIDGILEADEKYQAQNYSEAKTSYELILNEIPYADNAGLSYVSKRLDFISGYESVLLSLDHGDILFDSGVYDKARERYSEAKSESRRIGYEEGKIQAENKLLSVDQEIAKEQEDVENEAAERSKQLLSANEMLSAGDEALKNGDYLSAKANYTTASEILEKAGESTDTINEKLNIVDEKITESDNEKATAANYALLGDEAYRSGDLETALENYEYARRLYVSLEDEIATIEIDQKISTAEKKKEENEKLEEEARQQEETQTEAQTTAVESESESEEIESVEIGPGIGK